MPEHPPAGAATAALPLERLAAAVAGFKQRDPMAAVTVVAPSNVAGIVARRHLAGALGGAGRSGVAGLEVATLGRLAERLAAPALAPRRPATRTVTAAAWRRALAESPGRFRDIATHPATVRALVEAHADLRDLSDDGLAAVGDATAVGADLVRLHRLVTARLHARWYDTTDVLGAAAARVRADGYPGAVVLYLPQRLTRAETRFAQALGATAGLTVVAGRTGVRRADRAIDGALAALGVEAAVPDGAGGEDADVPEPPTAGRVLTASDSDDEVRCVVREVVRALASTPAHRLAVLYADATPYARLLHEHLGAAGVTTNGPGTRPADERAVSRVLLEVMDLAAHDVPRAGLFQALAGAPVRDFAGTRIPVARWERLSRSAGVVAGDDWPARLDTYLADRRAETAAEADPSTGEEEPREWLLQRLARETETAQALRDFACRLRDELVAAQRMTTWAELASWAGRLFAALVGTDDALRMLPAEEQAAAAAVVGVLRGLEGLDGVDDGAAFDVLRDVLAVELAGSLPRVGRFGEGVLVAPLSAAVGLDVDVVFVCGLSEDLCPGRLRADALLPERARAATRGELPSTRERIDTRHRHLLTAFGAARVEAVASFPRGDLRRSTRRLPSRFLLPSLRAISGRRDLAATGWAEPDYDGRLVSAGSFAGALLATPDPATEQEWRTRQAAAGRLDDPAVVAAVEMVRARAGSSFTRFDGNLAGVGGLPDFAVEERAVSPTALESYARCPHAFLVGRLLGVAALEQPEDVVQISPSDVGNLVHRSVEQLVAEFADALPGPGQPWTPAQRDRFVGIVCEQADDYERRGLTGHPRLWAGERARIVDDALRLLADDDEWRAAVGAGVLASELPFGMHGRPPVEIAVPGGRVLLRGSADKVDLGADGTLYVTDIKTGSARSFAGISTDDPVVAGTKLQLPVYAHAARQRFGTPGTPVRAAYWFVRRDRGRIELELTAEVEQVYARTLGVLVRSIADGLFPLRAPESADFAFTQCEYCNPDGIGHADERRRWERKRGAPELRGLVGLIEPEALADAGTGSGAAP